MTDAIDVRPDGPEIEIAAARRRMTTEKLLRSSTRAYRDHVLFPFDWVSHERERIVNVLADLWQFPGCQLVMARNPETDLVGYRGAASFNLVDSPFRQRSNARGCPA